MSEFYWKDNRQGNGISLQILSRKSVDPDFDELPYGRVYKVHATSLWNAEEYRKVPAGDSRITQHPTEEEAKAYLLAVVRMR